MCIRDRCLRGIAFAVGGDNELIGQEGGKLAFSGCSKAGEREYTLPGNGLLKLFSCCFFGHDDNGNSPWALQQISGIQKPAQVDAGTAKFGVDQVFRS